MVEQWAFNLMVQGSNPCILIRFIVCTQGLNFLMSQVDISMFLTITQAVSIIGLVFYSFWLGLIFYYFATVFNITYIAVTKIGQSLILLFTIY